MKTFVRFSRPACFGIFFLTAVQALMAVPTVTGGASIQVDLDNKNPISGITYSGDLKPYYNGLNRFYGSATLGNSVDGGLQFDHPREEGTSSVSIGGKTGGTLNGGVFSLGAESYLELENAASGYYRAEASVNYSNEIDLSGLVQGQLYVLDLTMLLTGTTFSQGGVWPFVDVVVSLSGSAIQSGGWFGSQWGGRFQGGALISTGFASGGLNNKRLEFVKQAGDQATLTVGMTVVATQQTVSAAQEGLDMMGRSDFLHTLVLQDIDILTANGGVAREGPVKDLSGNTLSAIPPAPAVPDAGGTLGLLGGALAGLMVWHRRRVVLSPATD